MNIYDFTVKDAQGNDVSLSEYKDDVMLIVNTATGCGFTPQYEGLENLYKKYKDQGFVVLDFPFNQFLKQAHGTDKEIEEFCTLKYDTTFPRFKKVNVNGNNAIPLFKWLREQKGGFLTNAIKWNFTKFLIDRSGNVVKRYSPMVSPAQIEEEIKILLTQPK